MRFSRLLLPLLLLLPVWSLSSCQPTNQSEHHEMAFVPLSPYGRHLYADQVEDSLYVRSTDSFTLTPQAEGTDQPWFALSPELFTVPQQHIALQKATITTTPNTTGRPRRGRIVLAAPTGSIGPLAMPVVQWPWLDILLPAPSFSPQAEQPTFAQFVPYGETSCPIAFVLHTPDLSTVRLESNAPWCQLPPAEGLALKRGKNEIQLQLKVNPSAGSRVALITLTSGGVSSVIQLLQEGHV